MTVTELREALQTLEVQGKGALPIGYRDCVCNDSDYSIDFAEIQSVDEEQPEGPGFPHRVELL